MKDYEDEVRLKVLSSQGLSPGCIRIRLHKPKNKTLGARASNVCFEVHNLHGRRFFVQSESNLPCCDFSNMHAATQGHDTRLTLPAVDSEGWLCLSSQERKPFGPVQTSWPAASSLTQTAVMSVLYLTQVFSCCLPIHPDAEKVQNVELELNN